MPSVALAPAQLCATRRISGLFPPAMAAWICANWPVVCLKKHVHEFAQAVRIAVRQVVEPVHIDRGLGGGGNRWRRCGGTGSGGIDRQRPFFNDVA